MRSLVLLPFVFLAACSSGPDRNESARIFTAATTVLGTAQAQAIASAQGSTVAPADDVLAIDFSYPCTLGGSVAMSGAYSLDYAINQTVFDVTATFDACHEALGTLDGELQFLSTTTEDASGNQTATSSMTGTLAWEDANGTATCDLESETTISSTGLSSSGSVCGHDWSSSTTW